MYKMKAMRKEEKSQLEEFRRQASRRKRVSFSTVYCSISENFRVMYTDETRESSVGVTVAVLAVPRSLEG